MKQKQNLLSILMDVFKKEVKDKNENKPKKEVKKEIYWQLTIFKTDRTISELITLKPDSDDFEGEHVYDEFLEWFQCSNNPTYVFWFNNHDLKIFVRDKITEIQLIKKEI